MDNLIALLYTPRGRNSKILSRDLLEGSYNKTCNILNGTPFPFVLPDTIMLIMR